MKSKSFILVRKSKSLVQRYGFNAMSIAHAVLYAHESAVKSGEDVLLSAYGQEFRIPTHSHLNN